MQATFYNNKSDDRYVDKDIAELGRCNIVFKSDEDMIRPTFKLTDSNISEDANYIYVADLNRFYYIRERTYSRQCLYLRCEVDVLMSFKHDINQMQAVISRNEKLYNLYLNDDKMKMYNYPYYQTLNMKCVEGTPFEMGTNHILLALVGAI